MIKAALSRAIRYIFVSMLALQPLASYAEIGDGHFDAPSSDNYLNYNINNIGGSTLGGLRIDHINPIPGTDPAGIFGNKTAITTKGPFDIPITQDGHYRLGPYFFGAVDTKQKCEAFNKNPRILVYFDSEAPLVQGDTLQIEIKVKPDGFDHSSFSSSLCHYSWVVDKCECSVGSCTYSDGQGGGTFPGCQGWPPDENFIVSTKQAEEYASYDPNATIGVLHTPFFAEATMSLLTRLNVSARLVEPDTDLVNPVLAEQIKILIIPTAGLGYLSGSDVIRRGLEEYVLTGGSLIVWSQVDENEWSSLPGEIDAYGYVQDLACFRGGARLTSDHPVLSSESSGTSDVHMDGFFVDFPPDSEELLIRQANNQPALIIYPYGAGTVIATSMYPDYSFWSGQYSTDELNYTRDMITWALQPADLLEYSPGDTDPDFTFTLELPADAPAEAVAAHVMVLDPDRSQILVDDHLPVYLAPGDLVQVSLALPELPNKLGIWHLAYELVDVDGNVIHEERECLDGRFVVADWHLSTISIPGLTYFLTQSKDTYELGEVAHFELTFVNGTSSDIIVPEARWDLNHRPQWNGVPWEQDILVPASGSTTISKDISTTDPLMPWNYRFWAHIKLPNGRETTVSTWGQIETKRSIKPLSLVSDHRSYYTWDTIRLDALLMNDGEVGNTADVAVRIFNSNESVVFEEQRQTDIILGGTAHEIFTAQLNLAPGVYTAEVRTLIHGLLQGSQKCSFSVASDVRVSLVLPSTLEPNAVNTVGVKTKNSTGAVIPDSEGTVTLDLTSGQETLWSGEVALPGLEPGESVIKWFDVMIPQLVFTVGEDIVHVGCPFWGYNVKLEGILKGGYYLNYQTVLPDVVRKGARRIGSEIHVGLTLNNSPETLLAAVKIGERADFSVQLELYGDFAQTIYNHLWTEDKQGLPEDFAIDKTFPASLLPGETVSFRDQPLVDEYFAPMTHHLRLESGPLYSVVSSSITRYINTLPVTGEIKISGVQKTYREPDTLSFSFTHMAENFVGQLSPVLSLSVGGVAPSDYSEAQTVTVDPSVVYPSDDYSFGLRGDIEPGIYNVQASMEFPNSQVISGAETFNVPPSHLALSGGVAEYNPDDPVVLTVTNDGGVHTFVDLEASLEDSSGTIVASSLPLSGARIECCGGQLNATAFTVPADLREGTYILRAFAYDGRTREAASLVREVTVHGANALLDVWTHKDIYSSAEPIRGEGLLTAAGLGLAGDFLNLQIIRLGVQEQIHDSWPSYRHDAANTGRSRLASSLVTAPDLLWSNPIGASVDEFTSTPVVDDLNGDGLPEVVYLKSGSAPGEEGELWIFNGEDGVPWGGGPAVSVIAMNTTPAIGNLDGDSIKEIVVGCSDPNSPGFYVIKASSAEQISWHRYIDNDLGPVFSSPALADLDGQPGLEIILQGGGYPYYDYDVNEYYPGQGPMAFDGLGNRLWAGVDDNLGFGVGGNSSPAVGDIDGDQVPEVVVGFSFLFFWDGYYVNTGGVHAFNADGSPKWSYFPDLAGNPEDSSVLDYGPVYNAPVIADLEGDGSKEVIFQRGYPYNWNDGIGGLVVLDGDTGSLKWMSNYLDSGYSGYFPGMAPAVGNIDGDAGGTQEIVVLDESNSLLVFAADGQLLGLPYQFDWNVQWDRRALNSSPVLADVDGDKKLEAVLHCNSAVDEYEHSTPGLTLAVNPENGTLLWDKPLGGYSSISVADLNLDGKAELLSAGEDGDYNTGIFVLDGRGSPQQLIDDFEQDTAWDPPAGWTVSDPYSVVVADEFVISGNLSGSIYSYDGIAWMEKEIAVPPSMDTLSLQYKFGMWEVDPSPDPVDVFRVYLDVGGDLYPGCSVDQLTAQLNYNPANYIYFTDTLQCSIDVSQWAGTGQPIYLVIELQDAENLTELLAIVDDVKLYSSAPEGGGETGNGSLVTQVLWSETSTVTLAPSDPAMELGRTIEPTELNPPGETGRFYWRGTVSNGIGQVIAQKLYPFDIVDAPAAADIYSDRMMYKVGEPYAVVGRVTSITDLPLENLSYEWTITSPDGNVAGHGEIGSINLGPGEEQVFDLGAYPAAMQGYYQLDAQVSQNNTLLSSMINFFSAEIPQVSSSLTAPVLAGDDPFNAIAEASNAGPVSADMNLQLSAYSASEDLVDDFEDGTAWEPPPGWSVSNQDDVVLADELVISGGLSATIYAYGDMAWMSKELEVPAGVEFINLKYRYYIWEINPSLEPVDVFKVYVKVDGKSYPGCSMDEQTAALSPEPEYGGFITGILPCSLDARDWAGTGKTLRLVLSLEDGGAESGLLALVDDIALVSAGEDSTALTQVHLLLEPGTKQLIKSPSLSVGQDIIVNAIYTGDYNHTDAVLVIYGLKADISAEADLFYPSGDVNLEYSIYNNGLLFLDNQAQFTLTRSDGSQAGSTIVKYMLEPASHHDGILPFNLDPDTYTLAYSTRNIEKSLSFTVVPQQGLISLSADPVYPAGVVDVPSSITNTGMFAGDFTTRYTIYSLDDPGAPLVLGQYLISPFLDSGATRDITISDDLGAGLYRVEAMALWPGASQVESVDFSVIDIENIQMDGNLAAASQGIIPVTVILDNLGLSEFQGTLGLETTFWTAQRAVLIPLAGSTESFQMPIANTPAGNYDLDITLYRSSGEAYRHVVKPFEIKAPDIILASTPGMLSFDAGGTGFLPYSIQNLGDQQGEARFDVEGMESSLFKQDSYLPGESKTVTFDFDIPNDIEQNTYYAHYYLSGPDAQEAKGITPFFVRGVKVEVTATQDRPLYCSGDTLHFNMDVQNIGSLSNVDLVAHVSYNGFQEDRPFTLPAIGDHVALDFDVPINTFEVPHIAYSVEFSTGRSLYINSQWVHEGSSACSDIWLWTDKQVYFPGEDVLVTVGATVDGPTYITSLDDGFITSVDLVAHENQQFSFTLPDDISSGTKNIYYTFMGEQYEYPFDVDSYRAFFVSVDLDKSRYSPQDTVHSDIIIWVNQDFYGHLDGSILNPANDSAPAFAWEGQLTAGNNFISVDGGLDTLYAGVHNMIYKLYRDQDRQLFMAQTRKTFDVGDFQVVSVATDKDDYEYGFDDVQVEVWLWAELFDGTFSLSLDGTDLISQPMAFDGYTVVRTSIPYSDVQLLGSHQLTTTLVKNGLTSLRQQTFQVVDTIPPEIEITGVNEGDYYNHDVIPVIAVTDLNLDGEVDLLNGGTFISGNLVANEDDYFLYVMAWDTSGNYSDQWVNFVVDKTPPELWLPIPDGQYINYPLNFLTSITEPHRAPNTENVSVWMGNTLITTARIGDPVLLDQEGFYLATITAADLAGNAASLTKTVTLDFTPPVIEVGGFENGEYRNSDVTVLATVIDEHRNPADESLAVNNTPYLFDQSQSFSDEATYLLHAEARDLAGNPAPPVDMMFTIDKTPPLIVVDGFTTGHYYNHDVWLDVYVIEQNRDYGREFLAVDGSSVDFYQTQIADMDGYHSLHAEATDLADNSSSLDDYFFIDKMAPAINLGIMAGCYGSSQVITPSLTEANLVSSWIRVDHGTSSDNYSFGQTITLDAETVYTIQAWADDQAGNSVTQTQEVTIDTTPPVITVGVSTGYYNHNITFTPTATDTNLSFSKVTVLHDGTTMLETDPGMPITLTSEGEYSVMVEGMDCAGRHSQEAVAGIIIDKTPPLISISGVADGVTYHEAVVPHLEVTDLHLESYTVTLNNEPYLSDTPVNVDGVYLLAVGASDLAGNASSTAVSFKIEIEAGATVDFEVTKTIGAPGAHVLGWMREGQSEFDMDPVVVGGWISSVLTAASIPYHLSYTDGDFLTEMRTGLYNVYVIANVAGSPSYQVCYEVEHHCCACGDGDDGWYNWGNGGKDEQGDHNVGYGWGGYTSASFGSGWGFGGYGFYDGGHDYGDGGFDWGDNGHGGCGDHDGGHGDWGGGHGDGNCRECFDVDINAELKGRVLAGDGLIVFKNHPLELPDLRDILGVHWVGRRSSNTNVIVMDDSGLTPSVTFTIKGKKSSVNIALLGAQAAGWYVSGYCQDPSPAVALNGFGLGLSMTCPFNPAAVSSSSQAVLDALFVNGVNYVAPPLYGFGPLSIASVNLDVLDLGVDAQCRFDEVPSAELETVWASDGATIENNQITWLRSLQTGDTLNLRFSLRLPDLAGAFPTATEVRYLHGGTYQLYDTYILDLDVPQDSWDILSSAQVGLAALILTGDEDVYRDAALASLAQVAPDLEATPEGIEEAIGHIIDALGDATLIESVDTSAIMIDLGKLLTAWQAKSAEANP